jgi:hypothetical protein
MDSPQPQSALTIAAAMMRMAWCGVLSRLGFLAGESDFDLVIHNWMTGILGKLDDLFAQYRAGKLLPVPAPRVGTSKPPSESQTRQFLAMSAMAEGLADSPQTKPIQRLSPSVRAIQPMRLARAARVRQPRPKIELYALPLPRGAFVWALRPQIFEKLGFGAPPSYTRIVPVIY